MPIRRLEDTFTGTSGTISADEFTSTALASVEHVKPHIQPGTLCPAVAGKLLDGSTSHSGAYGTAQSDGKKYYYTDIKGSKPIKDPRIGAHFGSQRHRISSMQIREQETATNGTDVYSCDGRDWLRAVGVTGTNALTFYNNVDGQRFQLGNGASHVSYLEITGYFNEVNMIGISQGMSCPVTIQIDGAAAVAKNPFTATVNSPLKGARYVNPNVIGSLTLGSTLGIHTLRINSNDTENQCSGIEIIAQDTTSTANKSKIQIPTQNVVSFGKKFSVSAAAHHYDPFNGFTNGTTLHSAVVDTATSLGLSSAPGSSASWAISGSNNIRPYNGGRVVKWVDSAGVIKTSVNMMPPNAQNVSTTAAAEITTPSATNTYLPAFSDDAVDHSLAEVAKTFLYREFGNGSANGNASYKDTSTMTTADGQNLAYVMDDGLTSLSGSSCYYEANGTGSFMPYNDSDFYYMTFIGTGLTLIHGSQGAGTYHIAQNLPYGTHVLKVFRTSIDPTYTIDGVSLGQINNDTYGGFSEASFLQPKMPPIPEDAVVISDYMLMADHVVRTADGADKISKGVRGLSSSRDVFYNGAGAFTIALDPDVPYGYRFHRDTESTVLSRITAFSTNAIKLSYNAAARYQAWYTNDTAHSGSAATTTKNGAGHGSYYHPTTATTLGQNIYDQFGAGVSALQTQGYEIVSPIHTSSHYQAFETPFLNELVGGDRNMEQNNLIVTADGKSWDEVTRDVSYIGNTVIVAHSEAHNSTASTVKIMDVFRGRGDGATGGDWGQNDHYQKDFAIAYDRFICLKDGHYRIDMENSMSDNISASGNFSIYINGARWSGSYAVDASPYRHSTLCLSVQLKRGDYVQWYGPLHHNYHNFQISRA